jgi:hypothetical protein
LASSQAPDQHLRSSLILRTEIADVRAQELFAVAHTPVPPDEVTVSVKTREPQFAVEKDQLLIRFAHEVTFYTSDGKSGAISSEQTHSDDRVTVGEIRVAHVAQLTYNGDAPSDEELTELVLANTFFMVYPYVRSTVQRLAMEVGLPPVVLPYLRRSGLSVDMDAAPQDQPEN